MACSTPPRGSPWRVGLLVLHRAIRQAAPWEGTRLIGGMAMGWGGFNLVEGAINHHVLGLHHVKEHAANPLLWDVGFLMLGGA